MKKIAENFIGPRISMVTPWSTNAVEITQNMDITGIIRIECLIQKKSYPLIQCYLKLLMVLNQSNFKIHITPDPIIQISDIDAYNKTRSCIKYR